jgi:uncharacterized membrane protein
MNDDLLAYVITAGVLISSPFAVRATYRLYRLWARDSKRSLILLGFFVVALIVTIVSIWVGFLNVRRLMGFTPLEWSPFVTGILVIIVLQVPLILDGLTQRIQHRPDQPDNIGKGPS